MLSNDLSLEKGFFYIITGPNGTGKSRMLKSLSELALEEKKYSRVICLSREGDDEFNILYQNEINNKYFYLGLGAYHDFLQYKLFERLFNVFQQDSCRKRLSLIRKLFRVIGFHECTVYWREGNEEYKYRLSSFKFPRFFNDSFYIPKIPKIPKIAFITFTKNNKTYYFHELSSGERSILLMILGVTLTIKDNSIIFYDEPENSMHPKWQEYIISFLQEIVMLSCNSTVVIATHSPLVISNVTVSNKKIITLGDKDSNWKDYSNNSNIEDTLYKVFNKITPQSHLLSIEISKVVKDMLDENISEAIARGKLNKLREAGLDDIQNELIDAVISNLNEMKSNYDRID